MRPYHYYQHPAPIPPTQLQQKKRQKQLASTRGKMIQEIVSIRRELDLNALELKPTEEQDQAQLFQAMGLLYSMSDESLSRMLKKLRSKKRNTRSLLYSTDWIVLVAALAGISRRYPRACIVALGFGMPKYMSDKYLDAGLLWSVRRDPRGDGENNQYYGVLQNSDPFIKAVTKCSPNTDFVVGLITLTTEVVPTKSHLLSFVLTRATGEFEVFDPNGGLQFVDDDSERYNRFLDSYFQMRDFGRTLKAFLKEGRLRSIVTGSVVMPYDWCPPKGIQVVEESELKEKGNSTPAEVDFGGYCGAWSVWWLQTRLSSSPAANRTQLMESAISSFVKQNIPIRSWMLRFAQTLTDDTLRILVLALRLGGRTRKQARSMAMRYARAKTACQKARNVLYAVEKAERKKTSTATDIEGGSNTTTATTTNAATDSSSSSSKLLLFTRARTHRVCVSMERVITAILVEAQASVARAVHQYSRKRIVVI